MHEIYLAIQLNNIFTNYRTPKRIEEYLSLGLQRLMVFALNRNYAPGSVVVGLKLVELGFSGLRGLREGLVEEGSRGTVGKPAVVRRDTIGEIVHFS